MARLIGGILLIIGTSIGSGMLALPVATAAGGFVHSSLILFLAWLVTTLAAFYILEVNLWLPKGSNMVSMAKQTLGRWGEALTWLCYCFLLYCLLSAYLAGGSDLLQQLFAYTGMLPHQTLDTLIFVVTLGLVVSYGVKAIDLTNRLVMFIKFTAFFIVVALVLPHWQWRRLEGGQFRLLASSVLVVITSYGYATIIPTLRDYFDSNVRLLKIAIAFGSFCSLLIYVLWDLTVQGNIATGGANGLIAMGQCGQAASQLTQALSACVHSSLVYDLTHVFTSVCMITSFFGVALCLSDFLTDSLSMEKKGLDRLWIMLLTLLPPTFIVIFRPGLFIMGLKYAGIFCVLLLMLLPSLMVWRGRYQQKIASHYQVFGGRTFIILEILIALALLFYGCMHL